MAKYIQKGSAIDYAAVAAIDAGDVVSLTSRIGIAGCDIPAGGVGAVAVEGVFEIAKAANLAIAVGDAVYYDTTNDCINKTNTNVPAGWAVADASASDTVVRVKIG